VKREKKAPFIGEEVAAPLHGGNPLFMVVTPILILHDIHAN
jgi:hypothetical protein